MTEANLENIHSVVTQELERRLRNDFGIPVSHPDSLGYESPLLGYCHENAVYLSGALDEAGIETIYIQWGAINYGNFDPPESIDEAEKDGSIHFWVEIEREGADTIIADLARETDDDRAGNPLVTTSLPDEYHRLPHGKIRYSSEIFPKDLRNREGYEKLDKNGLIESQGGSMQAASR